MLSTRAQKLKPSATLQLAATAKQLQAQGHSVISLSVGEPDWDTPQIIKDAAVRSLQAGFTKYQPSSGIAELRQLIAKTTSQQVGVQYETAQVIVSPGAKFTIFAALQMLLDAGDEALIVAPYWVSYPTMVELAGGTSVIIETSESERFKLTAALLRSHLNVKTKVLMLNSPSNPTGEVYTQAELKELAAVLREFPRLVVISDDIYNRLVFDGAGIAPHLLQVAPDLASRTVVVNGASKTYAMTGWRLGWGLAPTPLIQAMTDYQSQSVSCATSFVQAATVTAIEGAESEVKKSLALLEAKRDLFLRELSTVPGLKAAKPPGAFYLWVDVRGCMGRTLSGATAPVQSSRDFCQQLLQSQMVVAVPGEEFGCPGFLRLSFVVSEAQINEAISRIKRFVG